MPLQRMLQAYFMQQWLNVSDPQAEDALYAIEPRRRFAGVETAVHGIPDESTFRRFRQLLDGKKAIRAANSASDAVFDSRIAAPFQP